MNWLEENTDSRWDALFLLLDQAAYGIAALRRPEDKEELRKLLMLYACRYLDTDAGEELVRAMRKERDAA